MLCREMSQFSMVPQEIQRQAMEEFSSIIGASLTSALGGLPYAQRTLGIAKGDFKASSIMGASAPSAPPST